MTRAAGAPESPPQTEFVGVWQGTLAVGQARLRIVFHTDDVLAAVRFLQRRPEVDGNRIGLLGHSEGGWVIPLAAARAPDEVDFLVFMAGPAQNPRVPLLSQQRALLGARGAGEATIAAVLALYEGVFEILDETPDSAVARTHLEGLGDELVADAPSALDLIGQWIAEQAVR